MDVGVDGSIELSLENALLISPTADPIMGASC